jgi:hypothetical protein
LVPRIRQLAQAEPEKLDPSRTMRGVQLVEQLRAEANGIDDAMLSQTTPPMRMNLNPFSPSISTACARP